MNISDLNLLEHITQIKQNFLRGEICFHASQGDETKKQMIKFPISCNKVQEESEIAQCKVLQNMTIIDSNPTMNQYIQFSHLGHSVTWKDDNDEEKKLIETLSQNIFNGDSIKPYFELNFKGKTPIHSINWQYQIMKAVQQSFEDKFKAKIQMGNSNNEIINSTFKL